jgi:hypothetical protein
VKSKKRKREELKEQDKGKDNRRRQVGIKNIMLNLKLVS